MTPVAEEGCAAVATAAIKQGDAGNGEKDGKGGAPVDALVIKHDHDKGGHDRIGEKNGGSDTGVHVMETLI